MSVLLHPNGYEEKVTPKNGVAFSLTELQDLVDGYIGIEQTERGLLVFDEGGAENDKIYNRFATRLVQEFNPTFNGIISGSVVICLREQINP